MKRFLLTFGLWLALSGLALAQNPTCPTRPLGDATNACASDAFVQNQIAVIPAPSIGALALASGQIVVGQVSGFAGAVALSGDCTIVASGAIICLKTNNVAFGTFATQNFATPPTIGGTTPAPATFTALSALTTAIGSGSTVPAGEYSVTGNGAGNANIPTADASNPHLVEIVNDGLGAQTFRVTTYGFAGLGGQNDFHFVRMRGTLAAPTATQSGDFFLSYGARGRDDQAGAAGNTLSAAAFQAVATENWTSTGHGVKWHFETTPNGATSRVNGFDVWPAGGISAGGQPDPGAIGLANFVGVVGTNTNNNACTGCIGEVISSSIASGSAISLTSSTAVNITSITLTAGDWDISAFAGFTPAATTSMTQYALSISTTTGTLDAATPFALTKFSQAANVPAGLDSELFAGPVRASLSGSTTYFLVARGIFAVSTETAYGAIRARRMR